MTSPEPGALRRARWWDIEAMVAIDRARFAADAWSAELFWSELAGIPDRRWYQVAADATGRVFGYVGLAVIGVTADVQTIAVRHDQAGRGWGALLLDASLAEARHRGCEEVLLEVRADNDRALTLYERRGFVRIAVRTRYYLDGTDALILRHICC